MFSSSPVNNEILQRWYEEELGAERAWTFVDPTKWMPTKKKLCEVISKAPKSMLGPDGIPYVAWKLLGDLGVDILYAVQMAMQDDQGSLFQPGGFHDPCGTAAWNVGAFVFLPKKVAGSHPLWGDFYTAGDVRPLTIMNNDNRLLANGVRHRIEEAINKWVSDSRQGFLHGRSM